MGDCGHETGCDCVEAPAPKSVWHRYEKPPVSLGDRPRLGIQGHLDVCPDCQGAGLHKTSCPRRKNA